MGIWVIATGCAAFLLTVTALAAALLCRANSRPLFWATMALWWVCAAGPWCAIAVLAWVLGHQRSAHPDYFHHALFMALATVVGIPVLSVRARLKLFGKPDGANWPVVPLLWACLILLLVNLVTLGELDGSAQSLIRMARPQVDGAYLKLVGPDPVPSDNAADLYRRAIALCDQTLDAEDREAERLARERSATAPSAPEDNDLLMPSRLLGDEAYADSPRLAALLGKLQPVIELARQASMRPACRMEMITGAPTLARPGPDVAGFRRVAAILYSDALLAARHDRVADAIADLVVLCRMEQHVQQSERGLTPLLAGIGIGELTNDAIAAVLPRMTPVPLEMQRLIPEESAMRADLLMALRGEELGTTATLLDVADGGMDVSLIGGTVSRAVAPGAGLAAHLYRVLYLGTDIEGVRGYFETGFAAVEGPKADVAAQARVSMPAQRLIPSLSGLILGKFPQYLASCRCASVCIALTRHRIEHGSYPATLDELVPAYIEAIPADPFDSKPLRYRVDGGAAFVYSIGPDLRDESDKRHGREGSTATGDDIGFELKLPPGPSPK